MDRFDLEQQIMNLWNMKEDLELIYHASEGATQDEIMNALLGFIQMYEWKCERLFNTFEKCVSKKEV